MSNHSPIRRREFLKISAAIGGGLLISTGFESKATAARLSESGSSDRHALTDLLWIGNDNSVHVISSKVEMGQGIQTTLPMLIAEELDCDWKDIRVEQRPSGRGKDFEDSLYVLSTGGSDSTRSEFDRYRMAGAAARTVLIMVAARRLNVTAKSCKTENGFVVAGDSKLSYGALADEASSLPVPRVALRAPSQWKCIGKSHDRLDLKDKVNGQAVYGIDVQFPGLLTVLVAHPPVFGGKVKTWNAAKSKAITGVVDVVEIPEGIAVLGTNFWSAKRGRDVLQIEWDNGAGQTISSDALMAGYRNLANQPGRITQQAGDVKSALSDATDTLELEFAFPFLAHSPMETLNCTVRIDDNSCEVWSGTQSPIPRQMEVARVLGLPPDRVKFHTPYLGGSFGRRGSFGADWVIEAVHIAKASNKPIKLIWTREDDIKGGFYRPIYVHKATVGVGASGYPNAWHHHIVGQSLFEKTPLAKDIVIDGIDYSSIGGVFRSAYFDSIPNHQIELHTTQVEVPVLPWRSVSHTHTAFVMETIVDELAFHAHTDPVEYRQTLLKDHPRLLGVLNAAAEKSGWATPPPAGIFRGIAVHPAMNSFICHVVEISIEQAKPRVHRVVCAVDCGMAVNPDGIRAQMESGIIYGLTAALYGSVDIEAGRVKQSNFNDYKMLRINETPAIEVYLVNGGSDVGGVGEPGVPPIAPALGNAIFAATGKRIRQLPFPSSL